MLKSGGIWVSPAEVESRLLEHPGVREAAVVGVADERRPGQTCRRRGRHGRTPEELIAWCRDGLAHFKAPRQVVFVEDLPKTATGKLQRFKVRALLVAARSSQPSTRRDGHRRSPLAEPSPSERPPGGDRPCPT